MATSTPRRYARAQSNISMRGGRDFSFRLPSSPKYAPFATAAAITVLLMAVILTPVWLICTFLCARWTQEFQSRKILGESANLYLKVSVCCKWRLFLPFV